LGSHLENFSLEV